MVREFDIFSLILYITFGILFSVCIRKSKSKMRCKSNLIRIEYRRYYFAIILFFTFFAAFRNIDGLFVGNDTKEYIDYFLNCKYIDFKTSNLGFKSTEIVFYGINYIIRSFTNNYIIYFMIVYGFISYSYCAFIKHFASSNISFAPFICITIPYVKSFASMRTSLAIAFFLLGLTLIKNKKYLSLCLMVVSVLVHRASLLYAIFFFFYYLFKKIISNLSGYKIVGFFSVFIISSYFIAVAMQKYLVFRGIFSGTDLYYISKNAGQSILSRWPMFFSQLLLLIMWIINWKNLGNEGELNDIRIMCAFDFCILPATIVLNFWRAGEYMYLARLIMWGDCINAFKIKFTENSKIILDFLFVCGFIIWIILRLLSEYQDLGIMPYSMIF